MSPAALHNEEARLVLEFPPVTTADDASTISAIANLVNDVYIEAEAGIWNNGFVRTSDAEVADLIRKGQLALAYLASSSSSAASESQQNKGKLIGCVCVKQSSPSLCTLGMLALDKTQQGNGLGRDIFGFVERHCLSLGCAVLGLDILVPTSYAHPLKTRVEAWYRRLGFEQVRLGDFAEDYPDLVPLLSGPVVYKVFEKKLR